MDVPRILQELRATSEPDGFPTEALRAAGAHGAELVPVFLREIEAYTAAGSEDPSRQNLVFYAFHLLGEWKETRAYRPLAALLRSERDTLGLLLGNAVTQTIHRVMAQVFDGDFDPLRGILLDPDADEFIRWAMFETVTVLAAQDKLKPAEVEAFLGECFNQMEPRGECLAWCGWADAICRLGLKDLRPLAMDIMGRGWIEQGHLTPRSFDTLMKAHILGGPHACILDSFKPFVDSAAELSERYTSEFDSPGGIEDVGRRVYPVDRSIGSGTYVKPTPPPGRNDRCPCGSGKKYKHCCLLKTPSPSTLLH